MLIRTKLLALALMPVPLLLALASETVLRAQQELREAQQAAAALQVLTVARDVLTQASSTRDEATAAASRAAAGLEPLKQGATAAPALSDALRRLDALASADLPASVQDGRLLLAERIKALPGAGQPQGGVLEIIERYSALHQAVAAIPDLAGASAGNADLARNLRLLAAVARLQNAIALERIYLRHAILTQSLPPLIRREFFAVEGSIQIQYGLLTSVFEDDEVQAAFEAAFADAAASGREELLQQARSFGIRQDLLGALHQSLGYGGMLSDHARFLLNRTAEDRAAFLAHLAEAEEVLAQLHRTVAASPAEVEDLQRIQRAIGAYGVAFTNAAAQPKGSTRDLLLRPEDEGAQLALQRMAGFHARLTAGDWDRVSGALLKALEQEGAALADRTAALVQSEVVARQRALWTTALATLLTLVLSLAIARPLYRRVTAGIQLLVDEFERMARSGDVLPRQVLSGADELSQVNRAVVVIGQRLDAVAHTASQMAAGQLVEVPPPLSGEDRLAIAMGALSSSAREVVAQAEAISSGNYDLRVTPRSSGDTLALALNNMAEALHRFRAEMRQNQWLNEGQLDVLAAMSNADDLAGLAAQALRSIAARCGAPVGVLYVQEGDTLVAAAVEAGDYELGVQRRVQQNEGLVSSALRSVQTQCLQSLPSGYLRLSSGLGSADVAAVSLTPLRAAGTPIGVLELGWLHAPAASALQLLDAVSEPVALALTAALARARTEALLEETRQQAERLREQQDELQQSNEELEQQAQMLRQSEEELKVQREELQTSNEELEEKSELLQRQRTQLERTAADLRQATRYKSEFLANMSHELRTPLNSLLILSKSLAQNEDGNLSEEQVRAAQVIHEGGRDLLALINDILDLSKVEAGRLDLHVQALSVSDLLDALRRQFEPVAQEKRLPLIIEAAPDMPDQMVSDRQRVEQILRNLLSNALKFTEHGQVRLRVEPIRDEADQSLQLSFLVEDTGIGIPQHQLDSIFNAFQQGDGSTSRKYGGTGLGLAIARQLATLLGGSVQASSTVGKGSRFVLVLPQQLEAEPPGSQVEFPPPKRLSTLPPSTRNVPASRLQDDRTTLQKGERTILVIEDDPHFAEVVRDMVRRRGLKCIIATDGASGLRLAQRFLPSAVILDLRLPDMDGRRVLSVLKSTAATRHIPVHVVSVEDDSVNLLRQGAVGFLQKPSELGDLQQVLDRLEATLKRGRRTVLVVENDSGSRAAIRALLENEDTRIEMAETAQAARDALETLPVDCIVLDLTLPDSDGIDLLEQLRREAVQGHPPVVVYTARELSPAEHRRLSELAQSVVLKGAQSSDRLLDEVLLFLHAVEEDLPERQKQAVARVHGGPDALHGKKVLLVDDDLRNVFALSRLLRSQGFEVIGADNGQMALERLDEHQDVAVVLMDVMMPVMDGLEATRQIRAQTRFQSLPVIAVTARAMVEDRRKCIEAGASDYLSKPVEFDALMAMLRLWVGSH